VILVFGTTDVCDLALTAFYDHVLRASAWETTHFRENIRKPCVRVASTIIGCILGASLANELFAWDSRLEFHQRYVFPDLHGWRYWESSG
jgi:hypothetical protein